MGTLEPIFDWDVAGEAGVILALARVPGMKPQPCIITHYHRDGACIYSPTDFPDCFILRSIGSCIDRLCQVQWRLDGVMGIQFVNARTMGRTRAPFSDSMPSNVVALFPR
jgi:hypothetical protein